METYEIAGAESRRRPNDGREDGISVALSSFRIGGTKVSPNGKWLAYATNESNEFQVGTAARRSHACVERGHAERAGAAADGRHQLERRARETLSASTRGPRCARADVRARAHASAKT